MSAISGLLSYFGNQYSGLRLDTAHEHPVYQPPKRKMKPRKRGK